MDNENNSNFAMTSKIKRALQNEELLKLIRDKVKKFV